MTERHERADWKFTSSHETIAVGACDHCGTGNAIVARHTLHRPCRGCGQQVTLTPVKGTASDGIVCDDRCQYAVSDRCSCACGGENHSKGYLPAYVHTIPAWVTARAATRHETKRIRRAAKAKAERDADAARVEAQRETFLADPDNAAAVTWARDAADYSDFADSLAQQFDRQGWLSERQVRAALRAVEQDARRAAWKARDEQLAAAGVTVPSGRMVVEGTVRTIKVQDGGFHNRTEIKMLVVTDEGWKVWGTAPEPLWQAEGHRVRFTATLSGPAGDDQLFGYFARPCKAEMMEVAR